MDEFCSHEDQCIEVGDVRQQHKNGTYKAKAPTGQFIVQHFENVTGYDETLFKQRMQAPDLDGDRANFMLERIACRPTATCLELLIDFMDEFCSHEDQCNEVGSWGVKFLIGLGYDVNNVLG